MDIFNSIDKILSYNVFDILNLASMIVKDCKLSSTLNKEHLLVGRKGPNKLAREDTTPKVSAKFWYLQPVEENIFP